MVALVSSVLVLVIVCTAMGASPPMKILPTLTLRVLRRSMGRTSSNFIKITVRCAFAARLNLAANHGQHVVDGNQQHESQQHHDADSMDKAFFARVNRAAHDLLVNEEQDAPAVESWKRQQVHQA